MFETIEHFICLLYSPVASLYYKLKHYNKAGDFDKKIGTAIVFPFIENLKEYSRCYKQYLSKPVEDLYADSLCDAGLNALLTLRTASRLIKSEMEVEGCTILTMGTLVWSPLQKSRTGIYTIENIDEKTLRLFEIFWNSLKNKKQIKEQDKGKKTNHSYYLAVYPSLTRGLFAGNIAAGKDWFFGFSNLMSSKDLAAKIRFEKGGLTEMMKNKEIWSDENSRLFVEAVHIAIRNRYGALAGHAESRGEKPRFDREFEKMRSSLMRAKNQQTLRQEIADIFARGGINKSLQQKWNELLPVFIGQDWQKTRDLALFALASYAGKGAEEIENLQDKKED
jgi:CRISPR-associated protein Cas8a1/Csx13